MNDYDFTNLNVGDEVMLSGKIFTARDKAHMYLLKNDFPGIQGGIIYHCGPIVKRPSEDEWEMVAAGPTTSARMNPMTPDVIEKFDIKAIVGKGGMDNHVREALKGRAVYFSVVGGAALVYAKAMEVANVHKEEFGMPDAIWELDVFEFPVIVTMDSRGNSIYDSVQTRSMDKLRELLKRDYR